jgi:hypothetical protein
MAYTLTPAHVHARAADLLIEQLERTDYKRTCPARTLLSILFAACARLTSLSVAAVNLRDVPSAETVRKALRVTLSLTFVRQGADLADVVKRLLRTARRAGVRPGLVLLDRGFFTVGVIRYLQAARTPFLMPVPLRGRKEDHPDGPGGTRVFGYWKRSGRGQHTLRHTSGKTARVGIVVHCRNEPVVVASTVVSAWCTRTGVGSPRAVAGEPVVPFAVRDRDQLPPDEPVPCADVYP